MGTCTTFDPRPPIRDLSSPYCRPIVRHHGGGHAHAVEDPPATRARAAARRVRGGLSRVSAADDPHMRDAIVIRESSTGTGHSVADARHAIPRRGNEARRRGRRRRPFPSSRTTSTTTGATRTRYSNGGGEVGAQRRPRRPHQGSGGGNDDDEWTTAGDRDDDSSGDERLVTTTERRRAARGSANSVGPARPSACGSRPPSRSSPGLPWPGPARAATWSRRTGSTTPTRR